MQPAIIIKSPHSKKKHKALNLKKTAHEEYDKNGELITNHYVEYTVIGENRQWTDFMSIEEFKELNPDINID